VLTIESFAAHIPSELVAESGKVFYSGRKAFSGQSNLYVLGLNPGGDPSNHKAETIGHHTNQVIHSFSDDWSEYRDESWEGKPKGTYGMAPRILHLFTVLGLEPGVVPASNLIFVRSRTAADLKSNYKRLADKCWPFHAFAIQELRPRAVLCLGADAGRYVRARMGANALLGEYVERNKRGWRNQAYSNADGAAVIVVTHPSRVDWRNPDTDPSSVVDWVLRMTPNKPLQGSLDSGVAAVSAP
jgi:hypothetical protein